MRSTVVHPRFPSSAHAAVRIAVRRRIAIRLPASRDGRFELDSHGGQRWTRTTYLRVSTGLSGLLLRVGDRSKARELGCRLELNFNRRWMTTTSLSCSAFRSPSGRFTGTLTDGERRAIINALRDSHLGQVRIDDAIVFNLGLGGGPGGLRSTSMSCSTSGSKPPRSCLRSRSEGESHRSSGCCVSGLPD